MKRLKVIGSLVLGLAILGSNIPVHANDNSSSNTTETEDKDTKEKKDEEKKDEKAGAGFGEFKINEPEKKIPETFYADMEKKGNDMSGGREMYGSINKSVEYVFNDQYEPGYLSLQYSGGYNEDFNSLNVNFFVNGKETLKNDGFKDIVTAALKPINEAVRHDEKKVAEEIDKAVEYLSGKATENKDVDIEMGEVKVNVSANFNETYPSITVSYYPGKTNVPMEDLVAYGDKTFGAPSEKSYSAYYGDDNSKVGFYTSTYFDSGNSSIDYILGIDMKEGEDYKKHLEEFLSHQNEDVKKDSEKIIKKVLEKADSAKEDAESLFDGPYEVEISKSEYDDKQHIVVDLSYFENIETGKLEE